ncbi:MAG TPA: hypothetical protein VI387_09590, partial [Candidatus Brocadiales bacterium]|nr:hypothetical protein [Candidatus Brocadiales bacterium]
YVNSYLTVVNRPNLWQYIFDLVSLVNASFKENADAPFKASYILDPSPEFNEIFEALTIDPKAVQADERLRVDYISIRKKPFYKLKDGKYVVMYWSYFYNQIHLGLLFDFYNRSGIKEFCRTFPDFRSYTAKNVSERLIFNGIMKKALTKKHRITNFDDGNVPGAPDGYHRDGKYIFLFEFKDVLMPAEVSFSTNHIKYKEDIDTKFIANQQGDRKGIRQLLEHIKKIDTGGFPFDKFEDRGLKRRNLVVYPIIVYTHSMYSLPGVNSYLNTIFREELEQHKSASGLDIGTVKDVIMIDFQFFYHNFSSFAHGQHDIKDVLDKYYEEMLRRAIKWKRTGKAEDRLNANSAFETVSFNLSPKEPAHKKRDYVKDLFEALNIRPELSMPAPAG